MYQPDVFRIDDRARQHALIRDHALALLVTDLDGTLEASHVPMLLDTAPDGGERLRFHLARPNPLASALDGSREVLCVFQGPEAYVSPDWYRSSGLVPTWNYAVVHVYGTPHPIGDDDLARLLEDLSAGQEGRLDKRPWTTDKMDADAYARMRRAIVGFHMPVHRMLGKWKMSQNRRPDDRRGVIAALSDHGPERSRHTAAVMSELLGDDRD